MKPVSHADKIEEELVIANPMLKKPADRIYEQDDLVVLSQENEARGTRS